MDVNVITSQSELEEHRRKHEVTFYTNISKRSSKAVRSAISDFLHRIRRET